MEINEFIGHESARAGWYHVIGIHRYMIQAFVTSVRAVFFSDSLHLIIKTFVCELLVGYFHHLQILVVQIIIQV
jgi:hypothetical protein